MAHATQPVDLSHRDAGRVAQLLPWLEAVSQRYLRLRWSGAENIPRTPVMYVANHNGGILGPDVACTLAILWRTLGPEFPLYALSHDFAMRHAPPLGALIAKLGALRACRASAARVFESGGQLLVYPGGDIDAYRHWSRRNEVVILPRTGFIHTARAAGVPIVPIVAAGAHRSAFVLTEGKRLARAMRLRTWGRLERFPVALALPWGVAVGPWTPYLPLPFAITMRVLPPMNVMTDESPHEAAARVQAQMQAALDDMVAPRARERSTTE